MKKEKQKREKIRLAVFFLSTRWTGNYLPPKGGLTASALHQSVGIHLVPECPPPPLPTPNNPWCGNPNTNNCVSSAMERRV